MLGVKMTSIDFTATYWINVGVEETRACSSGGTHAEHRDLSTVLIQSANFWRQPQSGKLFGFVLSRPADTLTFSRLFGVKFSIARSMRY